MKNEFCRFTHEGNDVFFAIDNDIKYISKLDSMPYSVIMLKDNSQIIVDQSPIEVINEIRKKEKEPGEMFPKSGTCIHGQY